jgi:Secretion system C-terminal sorting domain
LLTKKQLIIMKSSFTNRFVFAALLCCGLFLINHNARAQCPDSTGPAPNPDIVPWTQDSADVPLAGGDCFIWIYFCERTLPGSPSDTIQAWLDGVLVDSTTECDSLADSTLIIDAQLMLDSVVAAGNLDKLEPCFKGSAVVIQAYSPACWEPNNVGLPGAGGLYISPCISSGAYCEKECQACYNDDPDFQFVFSGCVEYSLGLAECSGGGSWMPGGCFQASCAGFFVPPGPPRIETQLGVDTKTPVDTSMQAYPNPASGSLTVTSAISGEQVQILDVLGRVVMNGVISTNGSLTLDVSSLSTGTYYVSAGHSEVKFIKN